MRPNYVTPYKGLQGATVRLAATARNTGANPFSFSITKRTGFFYMHYTTQGTNGFTSHPKDEAMVKCLA